MIVNIVLIIATIINITYSVINVSKAEKNKDLNYTVIQYNRLILLKIASSEELIEKYSKLSIDNDINTLKREFNNDLNILNEMRVDFKKEMEKRIKMYE